MRVPEARPCNTCVPCLLVCCRSSPGSGATGASVGSAKPHARDQKQFVAAMVQRCDWACAAFRLSTTFLTICLWTTSSACGKYCTSNRKESDSSRASGVVSEPACCTHLTPASSIAANHSFRPHVCSITIACCSTRLAALDTICMV